MEISSSSFDCELTTSSSEDKEFRGEDKEVNDPEAKYGTNIAQGGDCQGEVDGEDDWEGE